MANSENLKPVRSKSEARKRGKKGGIASGEARREKKLFKEALLVALKAKDDEGIYGLTKIIIGIVNEAQKGNPKAFEVIRDTIGEKPIDKIAKTDSEGNDIKLPTNKEMLKIMNERARINKTSSN